MPMHSWSEALDTFSVSFGVVIGGSLFAALAALLSGGYPIETLVSAADRLKVWGAAVALGGSLINLKTLETGLIQWNPGIIARELGFLGLAFAGSLMAAWLLTLFAAG